MRFWDSSAIVPLLIMEIATGAVTTELERDPEMVVWWATDVECVSALARLERDGQLSGVSLAAAIERLAAAEAAWLEIQPDARIRQIAPPAAGPSATRGGLTATLGSYRCR